MAVGLLVGAAALLAPTAAQATAAVQASASGCLQGFDGPYDVVNSYGGISLKCGDQTKGVLHINTSHHISSRGADDVHIKQCMDNIVAYGSQIGAGTGNTAKRLYLRNGKAADIAWRTSQKDVVTMYTSTSVSNDWAGCAAG